MKQIIIILVVLLAIAYSYASSNPAEEAEHWEKVRQLDQLAERFKAETGFKGEVRHITATMRLYLYRGNFLGISFTADGDTIAFRQACEGIISKVLPYSKATSRQLSMSRISKGGRGYTTKYYQQVTGYRVEGAGYIMMTFDDGRKYFSISDNTVELPDEGHINITLTQAIEIAKGVYNPDYKHDKSIEFSEPRTELLYTNDPHNVTDNSYRLNYIISFWGLAIYIDPYTGNLAYTRSFLIKD